MGSRKSPKVSCYAVAKGRQPGLYNTWDECSEQVSGFPGARYKKFANAAEAEAWMVSAEKGKGRESAGMSIAAAAPPAVRTTAAASPAGPASRTSTSPTARPIAKLPASPSKVPARSTKPTFSIPEPEPVSPKKRKRSLAGQPVEDETGWTIVYCDGACKGNGQVGSVAGVGVWWGRGDERNMAERCPGGQTNNRAELIAIVRVLETTPHDKRPLLIKTDSQYSIDCFQTWLPGWIAKGWKNAKGDTVKNKELIQYLSELLDQRALEGQRVRLQYVRGHAGEEGNEGADWLANVGATRPALPERDWDNLREAVMNTPVFDPEGAKFAAPEVIVPQEDKQEFAESSQKLFSANTDVPIDNAELEAYAAGLVEDDDLLWDLEDDDV